jgi:hypothetical protein
MQVEYVAGIGFAAWRSAKQQRQLSISHRVLGQVVIHDQRVLAVIAEVLADRGTREGGQVLHRSRITGARRHDDAELHGMVFFKCLHHACHG